MDTDIEEVLQLLSIRQGAADGSRDVDAEAWAAEYISITRSIRDGDLESGMREIKRLETDYRLQTRLGKDCTSASFISLNGINETEQLLSYLDDMLSQTDQQSTADRYHVLKLRSTLYSFLMCLGTCSNPSMDEQMLQQGLLDYVIMDIEKYHSSYQEDQVIHAVLHTGTSFMNNVTQKVHVLPSEKQKRAQKALQLLFDPSSNDVEMIQTAFTIYRRFDSSDFRIPQFGVAFVVSLTERLAGARWDEEDSTFAVPYLPPSPRSQSIGAFASFILDICNKEENKCTVIQIMEKHANSIQKFGNKGVDKSQFKRLLRKLGSHNTMNCSCDITYIINVLLDLGENVDSFIGNLNIENNTNLLWMAKQVKDKSACFELGVLLNMDPDQLWDYIQKSDDKPLLMVAMTMMTTWSKKNLDMDPSVKQHQLTTAVISVMHQPAAAASLPVAKQPVAMAKELVQQRQGTKVELDVMEMLRTMMHMTGLPRGEIPAMPQMEMPPTALLHQAALHAQNMLLSPRDTNDEEDETAIQVAIERSLNPCESLLNGDDVIPNTVLQTLARSLDTESCRDLAMNHLGLSQSDTTYETSKGMLFKWKKLQPEEATFKNLLQYLLKMCSDGNDVTETVDALKNADKEIEQIKTPEKTSASSPVENVTTPADTVQEIKGERFLLLVPTITKSSHLTYRIPLSLLKVIKDKGDMAAVLIPCKIGDVPDDDAQIMKQTASDVLEPQMPEDLEDITPGECLSEYFEECFEYLVDRQKEFQYVVAVNGLTSHLAKYLKEHEDVTKKTKLILLNIEHDDMAEQMSGEEVLHTISVMRSSDLIFTIGEKMTRRMEPLVKDMDLELGRKYRTVETGTYVSECEADDRSLSRIATSILQEVKSAQKVEEFAVKKEDFTIDEECVLGEGRFSRVLKGTFQGSKVAVKVIATGGLVRLNLKEVMKEVIVMAVIGVGASHKNVTKIFGFLTEAAKTYILMELAVKSMEDFIRQEEYKKTDMRKRNGVAVQVCSGLAFLHSKHIVHQDIKPSNILFSLGGVPKLSDFGTARMKVRMESETTLSKGPSENPGTPYYQAPEVQLGGSVAQPSSDVWTVCLVFLEWFTGLRAWPKQNAGDVMRRKMKGEYPERIKHVPIEFQDALLSGLSYERKTRPTAKVLEEQLKQLEYEP